VIQVIKMARSKRSTAISVASTREKAAVGLSPKEVMGIMGISRKTYYRYMSPGYDYFLSHLPPPIPPHQTAPQASVTSRTASHSAPYPPCVQERAAGTGHFLPGCAPGTGRQALRTPNFPPRSPRRNVQEVANPAQERQRREDAEYEKAMSQYSPRTRKIREDRAASQVK
jgi:hypothetical protein